MPVTLPVLATAATEAINPFALLLVMMVVVFLILGLLVLLVSLVGRIFIAADRKKAAAPAKSAPEKAAPAPAKAAAVPAPAAPAAPVVQDGIEEETAAVIMAAVAAYESANGTNGVIRSISRSDAPAAPAASFGTNAPARRTRSAWAEAGIRQNLNSLGN